MPPMKAGPPYRNPHLAGTLSTVQLARRWHVSCGHIRRMLGRQELPFVDICGEIRIPLKSVECFERRRPSLLAKEGGAES